MKNYVTNIIKKNDMKLGKEKKLMCGGEDARSPTFQGGVCPLSLRSSCFGSLFVCVGSVCCVVLCCFGSYFALLCVFCTFYCVIRVLARSVVADYVI